MYLSDYLTIYNQSSSKIIKYKVTKNKKFQIRCLKTSSIHRWIIHPSFIHRFRLASSSLRQLIINNHKYYQLQLNGSAQVSTTSTLNFSLLHSQTTFQSLSFSNFPSPSISYILYYLVYIHFTLHPNRYHSRHRGKLFFLGPREVHFLDSCV